MVGRCGAAMHRPRDLRCHCACLQARELRAPNSRSAALLELSRARIASGVANWPPVEPEPVTADLAFAPSIRYARPRGPRRRGRVPIVGGRWGHLCVRQRTDANVAVR